MTTKATASPAGGPAAEKKRAALVEVTLAKPHIRKRTPYARGAKLKVTEAERDTLIERGVVAVPREA